MPIPAQGSGILLGPAPKTHTLEQDKTRPPQETVAWARQRLGRLGERVLRQTVRIDSGRLDIPVFLSMCGDQASALTGTQKQMGKGASPAQAEASALMELAERFSFFAFMNQPRPLLVPSQAPAPVMDFSQVALSLHHPFEDLERARRVWELLPQTWTWARNLTSGQDEAIPLGWFHAINEYNGPAAGNRQEEALLQSLCEVVERHACALVSLEQRPCPSIDPQSVSDPVAVELMEKFANAGITVHLKDLTCGLGVPTVAALGWDPASFPATSEIVYAAGAASSPSKALIRALTEVAQLAGDFCTGSNYKVSGLPKFATLEEAQYVIQAPRMISLEQMPDVSRDDISQEVAACVAALAQRGLTVYSLAVTHPEVDIPAVYTIIPGAHFAMRTTGTEVIFHAARLASQLPDPREAQKVLEQMAQAAGPSYYLAFFQALALLNLEQPLPALELLDQALTMDPPPQEAASIHTHRGAALKDLERYAEALTALEQAAQAPEPHQEVFNLLGFCHFKLGQHTDAIEAFSRAIEIEPGLAINYANIGSNLRELGHLEEACRMYRHALDLDPGLDFARQNLETLQARLQAGPQGQ